MVLGGKLVIETVDAILQGTVKAMPQDKMAVQGELRPAPKIFKDTCRINWRQSAKSVYNFIRGLSPYPAAWAEWVSPADESMVVKIFDSEKMIEEHSFEPGTIRTDGKSFIHVAVVDGFLAIKELQLPGKKRLKTDELLRGFKLTNHFYMKVD